jgi:hypothetical protein
MVNVGFDFGMHHMKNILGTTDREITMERVRMTRLKNRVLSPPSRSCWRALRGI